jgi:hypothetical protein
MMRDDKSFNLAPTMTDKDVYKIALDTRNLEISLFWQRSNYFLVLNTALAIGFFSQQDGIFAYLIALFGLIASALWYRVNLGSKYWQSRWEQRLSIIEKKIAPDIHLFSAERSIVESDVTESLQVDAHKGCFHKFIDRQIIKKPSVSYNMTLLSVIFMLGWIILLVIKTGSSFTACR